ncbi:MAG TPA: hypothetical protein VKQ08_06355, partial [Cyclobacteriaceae bacterium]|nr:hypothetical protein [Cyclobacteriaceae bacterium]
MKRTNFHPSTLILFSALIVVFCFAGRSIGASTGRSIGSSGGTSGGASTGRSGSHTDTRSDSVGDDIAKIQEQFKQAFITGDSAIFLKGYTPDACVLAPN